MSADFIAGFISGIAGLIIGSPLDVVKTNDQSSARPVSRLSLRAPRTWFSGLLLPTLGLGLLNAILFWSYGLVLSLADTDHGANSRPQLMISFVAGVFSGVCVCVVSIPTELVKVQAQTSHRSSLEIVRRIAKDEGLSGFCQGALITVLRDAIGYGFYFLAYDGLLDRLSAVLNSATTGILLVGGVSGCVSWLSIFPLDTIKTRLQAAQEQDGYALIPGSCPPAERTSKDGSQLSLIADCTRTIYGEGGPQAFFRGVWAAMLRAFVVNAAIFYVNDLVLSILKD